MKHEELSDEELWEKLGEIRTPNPSEQLRVKFYATLEAHKADEATKARRWYRNLSFDWLNNLLTWKPQAPFAVQLVVVVLSIGTGYWLFGTVRGKSQEKQLASLGAEVRDLRQTMTLALLENPSAAERMRGVSYTMEMGGGDHKVTDALFVTLNNDDNVNVRLSALDALTRFAGQPAVRERLVRSIAGQDSPVIQAAIADVMAKLQETRAVKPFRQLLKQPGLDTTVRSKLKETINRLI